jgi:hypothetical protein
LLGPYIKQYDITVRLQHLFNFGCGIIINRTGVIILPDFEKKN